MPRGNDGLSQLGFQLGGGFLVRVEETKLRSDHAVHIKQFFNECWCIRIELHQLELTVFHDPVVTTDDRLLWHRLLP